MGLYHALTDGLTAPSVSSLASAIARCRLALCRWELEEITNNILNVEDVVSVPGTFKDCNDSVSEGASKGTHLEGHMIISTPHTPMKPLNSPDNTKESTTLGEGADEAPDCSKVFDPEKSTDSGFVLPFPNFKKQKTNMKMTNQAEFYDVTLNGEPLYDFFDMEVEKEAVKTPKTANVSDDSDCTATSVGPEISTSSDAPLAAIPLRMCFPAVHLRPIAQVNWTMKEFLTDSDEVIAIILQKVNTPLRNNPKVDLKRERSDAYLAYHLDSRSEEDSVDLKTCVQSKELMFSDTRGFKPHHFTPHFHYYMLVRLMDSLALWGATMYIHELDMGCGGGLLDSSLGADKLNGAGLPRGVMHRKDAGELATEEFVSLLDFQIKDHSNLGDDLASRELGLHSCDVEDSGNNGQIVYDKGRKTNTLTELWNNLAKCQRIDQGSLLNPGLLLWNTNGAIGTTTVLNFKSKVALSCPKTRQAAPKLSRGRLKRSASDMSSPQTKPAVSECKGCIIMVDLFGAMAVIQARSELRSSAFQVGEDAAGAKTKTHRL